MVVMGVDLALRQSAAVVIPQGWIPMDWASLKTFVVRRELPDDAPERDKIDRLMDVSWQIINFAVIQKVTHVFVEQYGFNARDSRAHSIGEMGGVLKVEMLRTHRLVTTPVPASQARKFLCGKCPRSKAKEFVRKFIKQHLGLTFATEDEYDAFVIANYGRFEVGLRAVAAE